MEELRNIIQDCPMLQVKGYSNGTYSVFIDDNVCLEGATFFEARETLLNLVMGIKCTMFAGYRR